MMLTDEERRKFVAYLEEEAQSNRILLEQMEKMPILPEELKKMRRMLIAAQLIVAKDLASYESQEIT